MVSEIHPSFKRTMKDLFLFHTETSEISEVLNLISKFGALFWFPKTLSLSKQWEVNIFTILHISPILLSAGEWGQLSVPNFEKGEIRKKWAPGGLKEFLSWIFGREGGFTVLVFKKVWLSGLNFKCWFWPVLAKQSINV